MILHGTRDIQIECFDIYNRLVAWQADSWLFMINTKDEEIVKGDFEQRQLSTKIH